MIRLCAIVILLTGLGAEYVGAASSYVVEKLPTPPSKFKVNQIDGLDVLPDGRLVVCLPSGEIFFYHHKKNKWSLFAEGLHNPLGVVALSTSELVVSQRPELTRIVDTDGDGKADYFQALTDDFGMSGNYHEFNFNPAPDGEGGFFFALGTGSNRAGVRPIVRGAYNVRGRDGRMHASAPYRGWVMRYTADGETIPWASGLRTPNGVGTDLQGNLFVTDNQGDWVGSSKLFHIQQGAFYGHPASLAWQKDFTGMPLEKPVEALNQLRRRACVVFPHGSMANSPTQPLVIAPEANMGPFTGQLLIGEMNQPRVMRIMLEEVDGEMQGACVPFLDGQPLTRGNNRLAWGADGSLYVGSSQHSWPGSYGLRRVSWTGKMPFEIQAMTLTKTGFAFTFTKPVNKRVAQREAAWPFKRYYYQYHEEYGSNQFDVADVAVDQVSVSDDGFTVTVDLTELAAWHIHEVTIAGLKAADGTPLTNNYVAYTVNRLRENTPPEPLQIPGYGVESIVEEEDGLKD